MYLSAVAATTSGLSSRKDGFRFDPPIYYPPTSQGTSENTSPGYPFYRPPPPYRLTVPYFPTEEPVLQSASHSAEAGAAAEVGAAAEAEAGIEAEAEAEAEAGVEAEAETEETTKPIPIIKTSNKIHIVGFDTHAKFIVYGLAAIPKLPRIQILTHHPISMTKWGQEGRSIDILDHNGFPISSRDIPCPELIHKYRIRLGRSPILDNIIISTLSGATLYTLARLRPYIDRRTTICLVQPGLGLVELLNERVFDVPELRPNYILCHSEHKLSRHSSFTYSLRHVPGGQLLLHAISRDEDADVDWKTAKALGSQHTQHMMNLLSAAGDLNAVGLPWHLFLLQKLPDMIYQSLADTISVILGCRFSQIRGNHWAMSLWKKMLSETLLIVSLLPEFRDYPWILEKFAKPSFRRKLKVKLERSGSEYSRWISMVRKGQVPPVDFYNGYFVRRAQDVGIDPAQNRQAVSLVKARQTARHRELEFDIPFGLQPYMLDGDRIGGGQDEHDPEVDVELDS
ncbi:hypothetical protein F4818DRAFT_425362 [Hypoxylon cercidicola]|nr:hypothetical protein F4818DRAFT_425362 [Hypoxylon cercidicola]